MRRFPGRTVLPLALSACVLPLAACSATSIHATASAPTSATAAAAVQESGRTLTQAQLMSAGVPEQAWPKDITRFAETGPVWSVLTPSSGPTLPPSTVDCRPLADFITGIDDSSVEAGMDFTYDEVFNGELKLTSYPHGRATVFFASIRHALSVCTNLTYESLAGPIHGTIEPLSGTRLGDESISFDLTYDVDGNPSIGRFDYVRVGAATVFMRKNSVAAHAPTVSPLLALQVAKLKTAES